MGTSRRRGRQKSALPDTGLPGKRLPPVNGAEFRTMEKIYGKHSVRAVFLGRPAAIRRLIIAGKESYHEEFIAKARALSIEPEFLIWSDFLKTCKLKAEDKHQGICLFAEPRPIHTDKDLEILLDARSIVMLDQVSNPQNLATILRSAAFFKMDAVMMLRNRAAEVTPEVARFAVGGAELVRIFQVTNLSQALVRLRKLGFWAYGLDERGKKTLSQADFAQKAVFVIGAEGEGLRPKTRKYCDELVRIPGGRPGLESLNAGVAAAVTMAERARSRD